MLGTHCCHKAPIVFFRLDQLKACGIVTKDYTRPKSHTQTKFSPNSFYSLLGNSSIPAFGNGRTACDCHQTDLSLSSMTTMAVTTSQRAYKDTDFHGGINYEAEAVGLRTVDMRCDL